MTLKKLSIKHLNTVVYYYISKLIKKQLTFYKIENIIHITFLV